MFSEKEVLKAYIECALWSSTDKDSDDDRPLDDTHGPSDLAPECVEKMQNDVRSFLDQVSRKNIKASLLSEWSDSDLGHDFWLSRNGHGRGFWDRGRAAGETLHGLAKEFGTADLYVGDDSKIHHG